MTAEAIDRLDPEMLSGMCREQLAAFRNKLWLTMDELYPDCDPELRSGKPGKGGRISWMI